MKWSGVLVVIAFVLPLLFIVQYSDAIESDPKGVQSRTSKNNPSANLSGIKMAPPEEKKATDQDGGSREETEKGHEKDDLKESPGDKKDKPLEEAKAHDKNGKGSSNGGSGTKMLPIGDSRVEECDPSDRCIDEKSKFVACLRVPGKDSLDLSLLIQNKGIGSLDVNISAPDFVNLEQNTVQLKAKESKEVKVSVRAGSNDTMIVLQAREGNCSIDFRNMIPNSIKKSETSALPRYLSRLSTRSSFILFLAAVVLVGLVWSCIRFRWMKRQDPRYQKVEVGLPVSTGGKKEAHEADGWDNSWGDDWDDEEAPMTPSKPILTPSSKGLASRKFNKDGWKD